jgi:WD40 repeat protein
MSSPKLYETKSQVDDVQFSKDGRIAVATSSLNSTIWNGELLILQTKGNGLEASWKATTLGGTACVSWLGANNESLISGSDSGVLQLWNMKDNTPSKNFFEHDDLVTSVSVKNTEFLSASWDNRYRNSVRIF